MGERATRLSIRGHVLCAAQHQHTHTVVLWCVRQTGKAFLTPRLDELHRHHITSYRRRLCCAQVRCAHGSACRERQAVFPMPSTLGPPIPTPTLTHPHAHSTPHTHTTHTYTHMPIEFFAQSSKCAGCESGEERLSPLCVRRRTGPEQPCQARCGSASPQARPCEHGQEGVTKSAMGGWLSERLQVKNDKMAEGKSFRVCVHATAEAQQMNES